MREKFYVEVNRSPYGDVEINVYDSYQHQTLTMTRKECLAVMATLAAYLQETEEE